MLLSHYKDSLAGVVMGVFNDEAWHPWLFKSRVHLEWAEPLRLQYMEYPYPYPYPCSLFFILYSLFFILYFFISLFLYFFISLFLYFFISLFLYFFISLFLYFLFLSF